MYAVMMYDYVGNTTPGLLFLCIIPNLFKPNKWSYPRVYCTWTPSTCTLYIQVHMYSLKWKIDYASDWAVIVILLVQIRCQDRVLLQDELKDVISQMPNCLHMFQRQDCLPRYLLATAPDCFVRRFTIREIQLVKSMFNVIENIPPVMLYNVPAR